MAGLAIAEMIAFYEHSGSIAGFGRQPFHWRTIGRILLLFLHCTFRDHDGSSGAHDGHGDRH